MEVVVVPVVVRYKKPPLRLPCSGFTALCCVPGVRGGMSFFRSRRHPRLKQSAWVLFHLAASLSGVGRR